MNGLWLPFGSCFLSFVSTCIMSYLALGVEITFWVAPIFSLIVVATLLQFQRDKLAQESAVMLLAAGSVGGMIGMAVGFSWPTFYFLHKNIFLHWMASPLIFSIMVGLLVIVAGGLAFAIAMITKSYFLQDRDMRFPTAQVVYRMIYQDQRSNRFVMMLKGVAASFAWSAIALLLRVRLYSALLVQAHTVPTLLGMGFVAGHTVTVPLFLGMVLRLLILYGVKGWLFKSMVDEDFVLTFALGMLCSLIVISLCRLIMHLYSVFYKKIKNVNDSFVVSVVRYRSGLILYGMMMLFSYIVLHHWNIGPLPFVYIIIAISIACVIVASIFGEVGVLDLPSFGSFIAIPAGYLFSISKESNLIVFVFGTVCVGLLINILFSWKIADLAKISFNRLLKFQMLGFAVAVASIGLIIWWYAYRLKLGGSPLFSEQALLQEEFITLSGYDHKIFLCGFVSAAMLYFFISDMSIVIAGCMMQISIVAWIVTAGALSYFIKNREQYYPFCFGLYASHALWLFVQALLL